MRLARPVLIAASLAALSLPSGASAQQNQGTDVYGNAEWVQRPETSGDGTSLRIGPVPGQDTAPPDATSATFARFNFGGSEGTTFECKLDGAEWTACESPADYSGLAEGSHEFSVRSAGDDTPATFAWRVDTTPPETTVRSESFGANGSPPYVWNFYPESSEAESRIWRHLDAGRFWPANEYAWFVEDGGFGIDTAYGLAGHHRWGFAAIDAAGNQDPTPEWVDFDLHEYPDWLPSPDDPSGHPPLGPYPGAPSPGFKLAIRGASAGAVRLDVTAPVRGRLRLRLAGKRIATRSVRAGKQRVRVRLGRKARIQLRKRGRLVATLSADGTRLKTTARGVLRR